MLLRPCSQGKKNGAPPLAAKCPAEGIDLRQMADQVDDLHTWLGARDETGAFPWAVGPVLAKLVEILNRMD